MDRFTVRLHFPLHSLYSSRTKTGSSSNQSADYSGNYKTKRKADCLHNILFKDVVLVLLFWQLHLIFPQFQAKSKRFRQLLVSWIKASGFSRTIVLSSSHAYQRDDQQLQRY